LAVLHKTDRVVAIALIRVTLSRICDDPVVGCDKSPTPTVIHANVNLVVHMKLSESGFKRFLFEYFHEGSKWQVEIVATSLDDAQARINRLPWAKPVGELIATVPASLGPLAVAACWLKNLAASVRASVKMR
jgi:hypothetical protein